MILVQNNSGTNNNSFSLYKDYFPNTCNQTCPKNIQMRENMIACQWKVCVQPIYPDEFLSLVAIWSLFDGTN